MDVDYRKIITIEPGKMGGKPCIRGMRMTVYDVLDYLASGMTESDIFSEFFDLTTDDIRACLSFAADREASDTLSPCEAKAITEADEWSKHNDPSPHEQVLIEFGLSMADWEKLSRSQDSS